jgi:hypothetical protein
MTVREQEARFREAIARALYRPMDGEGAGYLPYRGDRTFACLRCGAAVADRAMHTAWHEQHRLAHHEP